MFIYQSPYHYFFPSFHTVRGLKACVNPKEDWVKKHLLFLRYESKYLNTTRLKMEHV